MTDCHLLYSVDQGVATITSNRPDNLRTLMPAKLSDFFKPVAYFRLAAASSCALISTSLFASSRSKAFS